MRTHRGLIALTASVVAVVFALAVTAQAASAVTHVKVGVYDNPPFAIVSNGDVEGIIPDIIEQTAEEHDWTFEYVIASWPEHLENLASGDITVLGPVAWTSPRAEQYAFSNVTVLGTWGVLAATPDRAGDYDQLTSLEGARIAALRDDVYLEGPSGLRPSLDAAGVSAEIVLFDSYEEVLEATAQNEVDAGLVHRLAIPSLESGYALQAATLIVSPISLRFAGPLNDPQAQQALSAIDTTLLRLQEEPGSAYYDSIDRHLGAYVGNGRTWPGWVMPTLLGALALLVMLTILAMSQRIAVRTRTKELNESLARFRALFEAIPDAIFVLSNKAHIREFKPARDWQAAIPPEAFLGKSFDKIGLPEEVSSTILKAVESAATSNSAQTVDYDLNDPFPDGPLRHFEARISRTGDNELLAIVRDVTEERLAKLAERDRARELERAVEERTNDLVQANLELAAASQAKSVFLANMSHELRTPLNSVIGFSGTLMQGLAGDLSEEQQRQVQMIHTSGRHLLSLVNDVLDLSRVESGRTEPRAQQVDLDQLIDEAVGTVENRARKKNIHVRVASERIGTVYTDRRMLLQILINLLNNAVKFTNEGGITVSGSREGDAVSISVADTGPGIPAEEIPRAFRDFYQISRPDTAKSSGFGLGLPISARLADMLGGSISVESTVGEGSVFTVTVPPLEDPALP